MITKSIKYIGIGIFFLASVALIVYIFLIPYAYVIKLKTEHAPYAVYGFIQENATDIEDNNGVLYVTEVLENEHGSGVKLLWEISSTGNGSAIKIKVRFTENRQKEKLKILTLSSRRLKNIIERVKQIQRKMHEEVNMQRWVMNEDDRLPPAKCLCVALDSKITKKPMLMNEHVDNLAFYVQNVKNNPPRLYINSIDFLNQSFQYEFCYPLLNNNLNAPFPDPYYIKNQPEIGTNSLDFYGNFAATFRAWAKLHDSLQLEEKQIDYPIAELFLDSPFSVKKETEWHSKIFFSSKN